MRAFLRTLFQASDLAMDYLDRGVQFVVTLAISLLFLSIILQIVMRYFFGIPLFWLGELAGYLLGIIGLWGMASCVRHEIHVKVLLFKKSAPRWAQHLLAVVAHVVVIYYCVLLVIFGIVFVERSAGQLSPSQVFDVLWPRLALPTGAALAALQAINLMFREIAVWSGLIEEKSPEES